MLNSNLSRYVGAPFHKASTGTGIHIQIYVDGSLMNAM